MAIYKGYLMVKTSDGNLLPIYPKLYAGNIPDLSETIVGIIKPPVMKTLSTFISENPVLSEGQLGIVTDYSNRLKIGDGTSTWLQLGYIR